ncbi:hypothetical protein DID78_03915 [Candidatus Marinamargulisbacteria bacterium SCGC AG-343-D04]|nr:hypothetical protein DID78_03915 [Candidatus Marinamargulisbacteria bacterium SCGC AG-343-D04]
MKTASSIKGAVTSAILCVAASKGRVEGNPIPTNTLCPSNVTVNYDQTRGKDGLDTCNIEINPEAKSLDCSFDIVGNGSVSLTANSHHSPSHGGNDDQTCDIYIAEDSPHRGHNIQVCHSDSTRGVSCHNSATYSLRGHWNFSMGNNCSVSITQQSDALSNGLLFGGIFPGHDFDGFGRFLRLTAETPDTIIVGNLSCISILDSSTPTTSLTSSQTSTGTSSNTFTGSTSQTSSLTSSPTFSATSTGSSSPTSTGSTSQTSSLTSSPTVTRSTSPTSTGSTSPTVTRSTSPTSTGSTSQTSSGTSTGSTSPTSTGSTSQTSSGTSTGSSSPTVTRSTSPTSTGSTSQTSSGTSTGSSSPTVTRSTSPTTTVSTTQHSSFGEETDSNLDFLWLLLLTLLIPILYKLHQQNEKDTIHKTTPAFNNPMYDILAQQPSMITLPNPAYEGSTIAQSPVYEVIDEDNLRELNPTDNSGYRHLDLPQQKKKTPSTAYNLLTHKQSDRNPQGRAHISSKNNSKIEFSMC